MKGEKRYWGVFLRTLAAFLAVWLLMAGILTFHNLENLKAAMESNGRSWRSIIDRQMTEIQNGQAEPERKPYIMQDRLCSTYNGGYLNLYRVYDSQMNELARTPIAWGTLVLDHTNGSYDHRVLFDQVLTDEEQIAFARLLRDTGKKFYGSFYAELVEGEVQNSGLYGEVTGIYDEVTQTILPQRLVWLYEDHTMTLIDSDHKMFEGVELTTLQFEAAQFYSVLAWGNPTEKELLSLYRRAESMLDRLVEREVSWNWTGSITNGEVSAECGRVSAESVTMLASATAYFPWTLATKGLGLTYIATLLVTFLAAVWVSHVQIRTLKRERRFTRAVAHDIKTPAAVLRAYAEALHEGATPERQREYLVSMMEESDRMAVMVNELLTLSRMDGAKTAVLEEQVDLASLVLKSFERLSVSFRERGLTNVMVNLQPVAVKGDSKRLSQAVDNLAVNVLHHAKPGPVEVTLKQEKKRVVLTVENQCESISEDALKHLWEPFYKVDESRSGTGSGLGLAVVKNVVTLHGGTCSARTTSGRIEFRIELPLDAG